MFNKLINITSFKSSCSYAEFCEATRQKYRYIHNGRVKKFLDAVLATSEKRQTVIPEGSLFWRTQLGHDWGHHAFEDPNGDKEEYIGDDPSAHLESRMTPIPNLTKEGRANPKGISYLYLATDKETAMAEVRPWIKSKVSVGQFRINRKLFLIDCSLSFAEEQNKLTWESFVWSQIDKAFSEPVIPSDQSIDYVPTQIIAEFFKYKGFDGIAFKSSLSEDGHNVVLFDLKAADLINCYLYEVESVEFKFKHIGGSYATKKYYEHYVNNSECSD